MSVDKVTQAFLELLKAGLWTDIKVNGERLKVKSSLLTISEHLDWNKVYRLAVEQSIVGLVTAGIERFKNNDSGFTVPLEIVFRCVGESLQLEQANKAMNEFLVKLVKKLRNNDVYALLVKGQGVAQCYQKPLWRTSGDIDLLLDEKNYKKAEKLLVPLANKDSGEEPLTKHHAVMIMGFDIELHGRMPFLLSKRVDRMIDEAIADALKKGGMRVWNNDGTDIYLPDPDNDVILVWTHMLHHFFVEGVGLRQVCDWCRLLWSYKDSLNHELLESRIRKAGLMTEWQVFGALAVEHLGMPIDAVPLLDVRSLKEDGRKLRKKGERVLKKILECGNFGHNHDLSYRAKYSGLTYKIVALWRRLLDFIDFTMIFPVDAPKFFVTYVFGKI